MALLTWDQQRKVDGVKGIAETINKLASDLPDEQCPLLSTRLKEIDELATALSIMAAKAL